MKSTLKLKQQIFVNLKPTESELVALSDYWNAVDTLIVHNCFIDNNPMRRESNGCLFWEWAIVSIDGFDFPAPYHTASKTQSVLYTYNGNEVYLTHEDCVLTTACYYLSFLRDFAYDWNQIKGRIHPFLLGMVGGGVNSINKLGYERIEELIFKLRGQLTSGGWQVLD